FPALAIGRGDFPHITFVDAEGVKYAYRDNAGWHISLMAWGLSRRYGRLIDLGADWQGRLHAVYQNELDDHQVYAFLGEVWRTEVIDERAPAAYVSLDVSLTGQPRLSYAALGGLQPGLH